MASPLPHESRAAAPERRVVERARRGEPGAFDVLYRRYVDEVVHYVRFRVRDEALAEDLTQDVFVNAHKGIGGLRRPDQFRHWLLRLAHNRVLNHWRAQSARPEPMPLPTGGDTAGASRAARLPGPHETLEAHFAVGDVWAAAARLTDLQQQVVALRFVAGFSVAETASVMRRSESAVKNLQFHALATLRRRLAPGTGEEST